ncbi:MAG: modification methylase [Bacteroidetes bacterium QS_8_64_10]|nr:MAG: modification methylase [Bacteroidetes bacterium QS_8_64_10]
MSNVSQAVEKKETGAHFTPRPLSLFLARKILDAACLKDEGEISVLDPACGKGQLLSAFVRVIPERLRERTKLIGIETNADSLARAEQRLAGLATKEVDLQQADFLELCAQDENNSDLFSGAPAVPSVHVVIANPPYVRTQVLGAERSRKLASSFGLKGKLDLYQAFLVGMTQRLAPGGVIGVITSNRFLSTKSGATTRRLLAQEYDIEAVYDLGDTKLFDAAVLPSVFVGTRKPSPHDEREPQFLKIYGSDNSHSEEESERVDSVYDLLDEERNGCFSVGSRTFSVSSGTLALPPDPSEPWSLITDDEAAWLQSIEDQTTCRFGDLVDVRVGIKTNADEVFVGQDWSTLEAKPEDKLLRCLLTSDCADRWVPRQTQKPRVLYTHEVRNGDRKAINLDDHPRAAAYLEHHRKRLEKRTYLLEANRNWFEIWVPQDPSAWSRPKIVFPDISAEPKFFYDDQQCIVKGNCYWFTLAPNRDKDLLFLLQGIANSQLATRYHDLRFNNKLYAGRRRYLTQYVKTYPVPRLDSTGAKQIIAMAKELTFRATDGEKRRSLEQELEEAVARAFGVQPLSRRNHREDESESSD